jgi:hypothetical protein
MLTEKRCKGPCGEMKPVDEYHWKSKRRGTRQPRCKVCMSEYGHNHYVANTQIYKDRANARLSILRATNKLSVKNHLLTHPCQKCGETNTKVLSTNITSTEINNLGMEALTARLAQSVVLCRNCAVSQD